MSKWQKCPVCDGKGLVPQGFYTAIGVDQLAKERGVTIHRGNNVPKPRKRPIHGYRFHVLGGDNHYILANNLKDAKKKAIKSLKIKIRRDRIKMEHYD